MSWRTCSHSRRDTLPRVSLTVNNPPAQSHCAALRAKFLCADQCYLGVTPCSFGGNIQGRQDAPEWIRTAFHDMITHDAEDGTGGLDGSIWFELDRSPNGGNAFNNTFGFFSGFYSIRASAADLLAMSVVVATAGCGGPKIPFRGGRIDASEAGPEGVPEAHTSLDDTLGAFEKAGLNRSEMIAMVACGHTLGGVHSANQPEIVGCEADCDDDVVTHFDSSYAAFDNTVVTEYLNGTTSNPLMMASNSTLQSDRRIFGSDDNSTMNSLADQEVFQSTCGTLFERMINTVPAGVELSDPIEAIDIKPYIIGLELQEDGTLEFSGRIRVLTSDGSERSGEELNVHLTYSGHESSTEHLINTAAAVDDEGSSQGLFGETFSWFEWNSTIDAAEGISRFYVHVTTLSTNETIRYDNGGDGYPINDNLLYQSSASCVARTSINNTRAFTLTAALRQKYSNSSVSADLVRITRRQGIIVPKLAVETIEFQQAGQQTVDGWLLYEATGTLSSTGWKTTFDLVLDGVETGQTYSTSVCPRST